MFVKQLKMQLFNYMQGLNIALFHQPITIFIIDPLRTGCLILSFVLKLYTTTNHTLSLGLLDSLQAKQGFRKSTLHNLLCIKSTQQAQQFQTLSAWFCHLNFWGYGLLLKGCLWDIRSFLPGSESHSRVGKVWSRSTKHIVLPNVWFVDML